MWRPNDPVVEHISELPGNDLQNKRRRSRRRAWRDGLADQTVVRHLENVRSYRAFERTLVSSVDPRSIIELALAHRLTSLLWRLHRASAIETGLFELQAEFLLARQQDPSRGPGQLGSLQTFTQAHGHKIAPASNGRHYRPPATKNRCQRSSACVGHHGRNPAPSPNVSCASLMLTRPYLTAWALMKRDSGVRPRKRFVPSRRCDSRRL
jgi:hypothetical protein